MCLMDGKQYYQQKNAKWKLSSESIKQMCLAMKKTLRNLRIHSFVTDLFTHFEAAHHRAVHSLKLECPHQVCNKFWFLCPTQQICFTAPLWAELMSLALSVLQDSDSGI